MIDAHELHELAEMDTRPHPTVSLYLALDQTREARLQALSDLINRKKLDMNGNGSRKVFESVAGDLDKARRYLEEMEPEGAGAWPCFPVNRPASSRPTPCRSRWPTGWRWGRCPTSGRWGP